MTIQGVHGGSVPPKALQGTQTSVTRRPEQRPATTPAARQSTPAAAAEAAAGAVPVHAPPGTDPELWSVLTAEERVFFAKAGAMGPLTYGRALAGQITTPAHALRGGRLNVTV